MILTSKIFFTTIKKYCVDRSQLHLHKNHLEHQQSLASAAARPPHVHRGAARLGRGSLIVSLLLLLRIEPANNLSLILSPPSLEMENITCLHLTFSPPG